MRVPERRSMNPDLQRRRLAHRKEALRRMVNAPRATDMLWANAARVFLEAYYGGRWAMLRAITKHSIERAWSIYGWPKWEWIRVHILRRPEDEAMAEFERVEAEEVALQELARKL